jgi:hypothetical protein
MNFRPVRLDDVRGGGEERWATRGLHKFAENLKIFGARQEHRHFYREIFGEERPIYITAHLQLAT